VEERRDTAERYGTGKGELRMIYLERGRGGGVMTTWQQEIYRKV
jgi:hypothetical protein